MFIEDNGGIFRSRNLILASIFVVISATSIFFITKTNIEDPKQIEKIPLDKIANEDVVETVVEVSSTPIIDETTSISGDTPQISSTPTVSEIKNKITVKTGSSEKPKSAVVVKTPIAPAPVKPKVISTVSPQAPVPAPNQGSAVVPSPEIAPVIVPVINVPPVIINPIVTNFIGSSPSGQTINLSWSSNIGEKYIITNLANNTSFSTTLTSHTFSNLICGTPYNFNIVATDKDGSQSPVVTTKVVTQACPAPVITSFSGSSPSTQSINLVWSSNTGVNYVVTNLANNTTFNTTLTSHTFSNLNCGTPYNFSVLATDKDGTQSAVVTKKVVTQECPVPVITSFAVVSTLQQSINLAWSSNTGVSYTLTDLAIGSSINTNDTSYTVSNLKCGRFYNFGLVAIDQNGNQSTQSSIPANTAACP